jgi:hypothetical protein
MLDVCSIRQVTIESVLRKSDFLDYTFYNGLVAIQSIRITIKWGNSGLKG